MKDAFDEYMDGHLSEVPPGLEDDVERYTSFIRVYGTRISYRPSERLWKSVLKRRNFKRRFVIGLAVAMAAAVVLGFGLWNAVRSMSVEREYAKAVEEIIEGFSSHPVEVPQPVKIDDHDYLKIVGFVSDVF